MSYKGQLRPGTHLQLAKHRTGAPWHTQLGQVKLGSIAPTNVILIIRQISNESTRPVDNICQCIRVLPIEIQENSPKYLIVVSMHITIQESMFTRYVV